MSEPRLTVPLSALAEITMGQSPESTAVGETERGLPFLQGCAEFGERHPSTRLWCSPPLRVAKKGSVLVSVRAPVGTTNLADQDYCIGRGLGAVRAKDEISDGIFLLNAIEHNIGFLHQRSQGSTFSAIGSRELASFPVPDFNPDQQRRIAEILGTVDEVIEQTEALIAKQQQVKAGLMHDLFTRGVTATGTLRPPPAEAPHLYQDSPLGPIPQEWDYALLDGIAQRGSGHTPNRNHPEYWDGGIKWVSLADSSRLDRVYISETEKEISALGIANSSAVLHPPGIVVLSRDAGVGKSAITTCEMAVSQHFMCWRCGPKLDTHYLYYWLQYRKREFENIATGSTIPTIGLRYFKHYRLHVPSDVDEQKKIGAMLLSLDEGIQTETAHLAKLRQEKQGLMHDLLTGRVPVPVAG